jgi:capsular exopolysaccharide synthesis family protein
VLVDCDLRRPASHRLFDVPVGPGICELLRGQAELSDVIQATRAPGLSIITAGAVDTGALQALARGDLQAIFDVLKTQYDFIIVDSAPVLPVADTLVVSQHVDAVIFAILKEVSRVPKVHSAYHRLASLGVRILGAVVVGTTSETYGSRYPYVNEL